MHSSSHSRKRSGLCRRLMLTEDPRKDFSECLIISQCHGENAIKVGTHEGTCCRVMSSLRQIPSCEHAIFMKNLAAGMKFCPRNMSPEFRSVWIEGTCRGDKITLHPSYMQGRLVWTVHATCPETLIFLRQDPLCKRFKKPIPATCPFVWTVHEILSRDMSLQHVPLCVPTLKLLWGLGKGVESHQNVHNNL